MRGRPGDLPRLRSALERARRGNSKELSQARALASEIAERRPNWWGQSILSAQIAEIEGNTDEAIRNYRRAFQLGYRQSAMARRLVALLNEEGAYDQIDEVVSSLNDRGMPAEDLIMSTAIGALRQHNFERAVSLARRGCPEGSTSFADHLILARVCLAASRLDEAGKEFRRALELAPGVPVVWVSYVSYLVQTRQANQAKAAVERAAKALPSGRSGLALAECYALAGDFRRSDEQVQGALKSPTCNPAMVRAAVDLYMSRARFDQVEPIVAMMFDPAMRATPEDLAWASRTRAQLLSTSGRLADLDSGLALLDKNLKTDPSSIPDQRLKAALLAMRTSGRGPAIKILENLLGSKQLGTFEQFLLAQLLRTEGSDEEYRSLMLKILDGKVKNPIHLAHFINFLIDRGDLDEADKRLSELKDVEPQGLRALDLEARLLKARNHESELRALLEARGRDVPDQIGNVAVLLDRYGFNKQAEKRVPGLHRS